MDVNITRELVKGLRSGNQDAFKQLYDYYGKKLYYFSKKYRLSHDESAEIVQEVFTKIWEKRDTLNVDFSFNSYVITVAKNLIYNKFRRKVYEKAYRSCLEEAEFSHENTEKLVIFEDLQNIASKAIDQLPPKRKHIFKLSRESGMSNQEIAEFLNISKSTVENQMNKCLKFLKTYLQQNAEIGHKGNR